MLSPGLSRNRQTSLEVLRVAPLGGLETSQQPRSSARNRSSVTWRPASAGRISQRLRDPVLEGGSLTEGRGFVCSGSASTEDEAVPSLPRTRSSVGETRGERLHRRRSRSLIPRTRSFVNRPRPCLFSSSRSHSDESNRRSLPKTRARNQWREVEEGNASSPCCCPPTVPDRQRP